MNFFPRFLGGGQVEIYKLEKLMEMQRVKNMQHKLE